MEQITINKELNVNKIRNDFPILNRKINGNDLIYFDNAATTQKPISVIDAITNYHKNYNANVHRSIHKLGEEATEAYINAHEKVANFINADFEEIIFTRGATESLNLLAYSLGSKIEKGDKIIVSRMEHHSNFVPWQQLAKEKNAKLEFIDINDNYELDIENLKELMDDKVKIVAVTHVSNVLGMINDVKEIAKIVHENNTILIVDGAQSIPHIKIDVKELDCDFFAFSGHKMLAPTGIGVLYGKKELLEKLKPFHYGGEMIKSVDFDETTFNELPWRFEAGTPNIVGGIALAEAIDYLENIGVNNIHEHETELTNYLLKRLSENDKIKVYGSKDNKIGVVSFNCFGKEELIHPHDIATILDDKGIAIRAGHSCAMPLMKTLDTMAVCRVSLYLYNTKEEIDKFIIALDKAIEVFN